MRKIVFLAIACILLFASCKKDDLVNVVDNGIINHSCTNLSAIPSVWITKAKSDLHIAYGHTSHGSQIVDGMSGLVDFKGSAYEWSYGGGGGTLDLRDGALSGDLGNPDREEWEAVTRSYLASHTDVNVIIWSWCGQVSSASENDIETYLDLMNGLENDFPDVTFVYMTGHLDGTGLTGNLHLRNEQIRNYCRNNKKFLFDFEDIESYNPDGVYFGNKKPDDGCNYDFDGDGTTETDGGYPALPVGGDKNWAVDWQNANDEGVDWYDCSSAHSQPVNANMKAYAAWYLWARIAGWDGSSKK